jgi:DNA-binding GntR family transcriptional regulator
MKLSPQPDPRAYMKLAAMFRTQIAEGILGPGDKLPSITMVSDERGCSRQTAGRAMQVLERDGLVHRVQGLGYFVCSDAQSRGCDQLA